MRVVTVLALRFQATVDEGHDSVGLDHSRKEAALQVGKALVFDCGQVEIETRLAHIHHYYHVCRSKNDNISHSEGELRTGS